MVQKIATLQKRLIAKTEEVVEKDMLVQEKETLYLELKGILARQPGPEVAEQLSAFQSALKEKNRRMKAMASELNMYQVQATEHKYEIERLVSEVQETKKKYYEQKRRQQMGQKVSGDQSFKQALRQQQMAAQQSTQHFAGGGFNLMFSSPQS